MLSNMVIINLLGLCLGISSFVSIFVISLIMIYFMIVVIVGFFCWSVEFVYNV